MYFDQQFIKSVISSAIFQGAKKLPEVWGVSINHNDIKKGDIFVALKGNKLDGHDFIGKAIENGACGLIINESKKEVISSLDQTIQKKLFIVSVPDTREALVKLATAWREQFDYPVIGITGSVGKTSTREILSNILKLNNLNFVATLGNQNTELGVCINVLRMRSSHRAAIFEMGISKQGEMSRIAKIVRPTTAIITTIGHSHMEGLGSLSDIASEKRDIFKYFKEDNIGIINGDQAILSQIAYKHPIIKFGCKTTNQIQARKIQSNNAHTHFVLKLYKNKYKVVLDTNHFGRVINLLAAASAAHLIGVSDEIVVKGVQMSLDIKGRFEHIKSKRGIIIDDCYNASPESVKESLLAFEKVESMGQKIAVLGDMLELGVNSSFWHRQLGRFLRKVPSLNHVVFVGNQVKWAKNTIPVGLTFDHVSDWKEAARILKDRLNKEAVILVKGSQAMQLKNLVVEFSEKVAS